LFPGLTPLGCASFGPLGLAFSFIRIFKVSPQPPAHLAFVIILHAILHTRSHHLSLRAALPDIPKTNLRTLGL